ncbi:hypothetical protein AAFF_G00405210 [Aldrovandia affinis]|uniref:Uncharacterized protein n=1 Tax=Aldrovandia affinis TaxID=143900 RepID=A0AAD7X1G7_9TELE|nr:hypothetical protein AAFF_G00405210 [Aldrovandia affinis]
MILKQFQFQCNPCHRDHCADQASPRSLHQRIPQSPLAIPDQSPVVQFTILVICVLSVACGSGVERALMQPGMNAGASPNLDPPRGPPHETSFPPLWIKVSAISL